MAVGNVLRGLEMDASGVSTTLLGLLNPFALLIGLLGPPAMTGYEAGIGETLSWIVASR